MSRFTVFMIAVGGLLLASLVAVLLLKPTAEQGETSRSTGTALVGGPFELVSHTGQTMTEADFAGQYMLIYFGFTFCPDVCPTELQVMSAALDILGDDGRNVTPVLISIDPERDSVEAMAQYVVNFHPRLVGLTGTPEQVAAAASAYRVYYQKVADDSSAAAYTMDHSSVVYLMGPDGAFIKHFGPGTSPEKMAKTIAAAIADAS
ncbi:MAG: SCO family protein [Alphaproteobacteria bacterium]|nr:SCO family protein [Alphaproteobacteria bacterium]MBO6626806.1 SCO family protein [Alphaproteobacteria bacterium]MDF1627621.1 SCO family protein [Parvibaculaceae bacterium]